MYIRLGSHFYELDHQYWMTYPTSGDINMVYTASFIFQMEVDEPVVNGVAKEKKDQGIKDYYVSKIEELQVGIHTSWP